MKERFQIPNFQPFSKVFKPSGGSLQSRSILAGKKVTIKLLVLNIDGLWIEFQYFRRGHHPER